MNSTHHPESFLTYEFNSINEIMLMNSYSFMLIHANDSYLIHDFTSNL